MNWNRQEKNKSIPDSLAFSLNQFSVPFFIVVVLQFPLSPHPRSPQPQDKERIKTQRKLSKVGMLESLYQQNKEKPTETKSSDCKSLKANCSQKNRVVFSFIHNSSLSISFFPFSFSPSRFSKTSFLLVASSHLSRNLC